MEVYLHIINHNIFVCHNIFVWFTILDTLGIPGHSQLKLWCRFWTLLTDQQAKKLRQSKLPFSRYCRFVISYPWARLRPPDYTQLNQEYCVELWRSIYTQKNQYDPACLSEDIVNLLFWVPWAWLNKLTFRIVTSIHSSLVDPFASKK